MTTPAALQRARRWYRRLLVLYPAAFRERYGPDLTQLFADLYRDHALGRSALTRAQFWTRIVRDTYRQGVAEHRAARQARLPLGAYGPSRRSPMVMVVEDLRHAFRAVRGQPGLTSIVVLTLALGIGANSAIFTVVNGVLLRPLPFERPERVVMLYEVDPRGRDNFASLPMSQDWLRTLQSIHGISVVGVQTANLTGVPEPDRLRAGFASATFFDMLGVHAIIGRGFAVGEDAPGAAKTAILEYATWQTRFGADPSVVGRTLILNNEPHQVIGVLPARFEFPMDAVDVWLPLTSLPNLNSERRNRNYMVFGRIRDGVTSEQAAAELKTATGAISAGYADVSVNWSARFEPLQDVVVRNVSRNLKLLSGALAFVLLIACANVANLLLARAAGRQREMALRAALGASRARLIRQLLTEAVMMSVAGGVLGLLLSAILTDAMLTLLPNLPRASQVAPNLSVVLFTAAISFVTAVLFGTLPAWQTSRVEMRAALNESTRAGEGGATHRLRGALVVCELALSLVLLVGAGLLVQSLYRVLTVDIGYDSSNLLTLEYRLPRNKYRNSQQNWEFHRQVVERVAQVPGVEVVSIAQAAPQSGNGAFVGYWKAEDPQPPLDAMARAHFNGVTPDYFRAMRIPILEGRGCTGEDTATSPITVLVNRHLAERLWPGASAVGRQLRSPDVPVAVIIRGVVGNTRPQLLAQPVTSQIYSCLSQQSGPFGTLIARTTVEPLSIARSVQQAIWSVDADQPMWKIRSAETMVANTVQTQRFVMLLMASAALLALLLAALGTYSVLHYTVQRRAREVGVRLALGATPSDVLRLMLAHSAVLTAIGIGVGLAGALALSDLLATQLYEISPRDPMTLAGTATLLTVVALLAAWIPARRATALDPVVTLRVG